MPFTFTVTRDNTAQIATPLTVDLSVGGTATFGVDYTVSGATSFTTNTASLTIPANATSAAIVVTQVPDAIFESDETIILTIAPTSGVSTVGANPTATAIILNDDAPAGTPSTILLHFDGANNSTVITDSASPANTVTASGTAKISTSQSKFGGSSLQVTGAPTSCAIVTDSPGIELGSGDFTIELFANLSAAGYLLGKGDAATAVGSAISWLLGSACSFYVGGTSFTIMTVVPTLNQQSHIAITRQGSTLRYFIDGVQQSTTTITGSINNVTNDLQIGGYGPGGVTGFIDEFRLVVGTCLYAANFTPPINPYTN